MKPKLILGLALVLSGGWVGCSTAPSGALGNSAEGKLFSNQEAICLKGNNSTHPWRLKFATTERMGGKDRLFVTVHEREGIDTAAIYVHQGDKLKLLKRLTTGDRASHFLNPNIFWTTPKNDGWQTLLQLTELFDGTGALTEEHIFVINRGSTVNGIAAIPKLEEVEFIPAWESFKDFGKDEGLGKGQISTLSDDGLLFTFVVWKDEKPGQSAVAKITGTYKLERKPDGGWRISMATFKREPFTDEDWRSRGLRSAPSVEFKLETASGLRKRRLLFVCTMNELRH